MTFDLSKITGNEPPPQTENDKDAEIERLRAEFQRDGTPVIVIILWECDLWMTEDHTHKEAKE